MRSEEAEKREKRRGCTGADAEGGMLSRKRTWRRDSMLLAAVVAQRWCGLGTRL